MFLFCFFLLFLFVFCLVLSHDFDPKFALAQSSVMDDIEEWLCTDVVRWVFVCLFFNLIFLLGFGCCITSFPEKKYAPLKAYFFFVCFAV